MFSEGKKLSRSYYCQDDVVTISRSLIGKVLCSFDGKILTSGIITETEAYCGRNDKACHANEGLRTKRTEIMYGPPGHAYIYLCYGIHHLFNIVTNREGLADAVLIRAVSALDGIGRMTERRGMNRTDSGLFDGPGKLTQALSISTGDNGTDLLENRIWIEDRGIEIKAEAVSASPRIGIGYAGEHASRPWRFFVNRSSLPGTT
ncbi:MAG: DNA-3-methyladenine glycosylase [Balneolaceae bacterium]